MSTEGRTRAGAAGSDGHAGFASSAAQVASRALLTRDAAADRLPAGTVVVAATLSSSRMRTAGGVPQ